MEIVGYIVSVLIGISLGLIGAGGSILTVPVLVYLFSLSTINATTYSLFIVGITSFVGTLSYFRKGWVNFNIVITFGIPSIFAVFISRNFFLPAIPQNLLNTDYIVLTKDTLLMLLFACLIVVASYKMIRKNRQMDTKGNNFSYLMTIFHGTLIGTLTGLVGAGGGFLIIPTLVGMFNIPMKKAIGTSLSIVAINSLSGFFFSLSYTIIQWSLLLEVTLMSIIGIFIGSYISRTIDGKKLKSAFGWFIMIMGIYIFVREIFL